MKTTDIEFAENLIKGKITEVIFEQMIRSEKKFTVIPFGYEHTVPMLSQFQHLVEVQDVIKNIRQAPDFLLISLDHKQVYFVEVKYQKNLDMRKISNYAYELNLRWDFAWIFLVTPKGFFCSMSEWIINEKSLNPLSESWVSFKNQESYMALLLKYVTD